MRSTQVIILAGGMGKRVNHIYSEIPKPLFPVNKKPFLSWLLYWLIQQGIDDIVFALSHLSDKIKEHVDQNFSKYFKISYCCEQEALGTGGAIINCLPKILNKNFLVINADTLCLISIKNFFDFHIKHSFDLSIVGVRVKDSSRYGTLQTKNSTLLGFEEKTKSKNSLINAGIFCMNRDIFKKYKIEKLSLEKDILPNIIRKNKSGCFKSNSPFIDMGTEEDYKKSFNFIKNNLSDLEKKIDYK